MRLLQSRATWLAAGWLAFCLVFVGSAAPTAFAENPSPQQEHSAGEQVVVWLTNGKKAALAKYGNDFFKRGSWDGKRLGDVWNEILVKEGFPRDGEGARALARKLGKEGASQQVLNYIAMGAPANEEAIDEVCKELKEIAAEK